MSGPTLEGGRTFGKGGEARREAMEQMLVREVEQKAAERKKTASQQKEADQTNPLEETEAQQ